MFLGYWSFRRGALARIAGNARRSDSNVGIGKVPQRQYYQCFALESVKSLRVSLCSLTRAHKTCEGFTLSLSKGYRSLRRGKRAGVVNPIWCKAVLPMRSIGISKFQETSSKQISIFKSQTRFGFWMLVIAWLLYLGYWSFRCCAAVGCRLTPRVIEGLDK